MPTKTSKKRPAEVDMRLHGYCRIRQAAAFLAVSESLIRRWCAEGRLHLIEISFNCKVIDRAEVLALGEELKQASLAKAQAQAQ